MSRDFFYCCAFHLKILYNGIENQPYKTTEWEGPMTTTIALPTRAVLHGVPRVHFWEGGARCPEDVCFPSVMRAVMEYLKENIGCQHCPGMKGKNWGLQCSYGYFMLASGMAFAMNWKPGFGGETFAMLEHLSPDRTEPFRRAFAAAGYAYEYVPAEAGEALLREKITTSIAERQRPVISFGVVGPPEAGLITGYDEGGDVLLGWNFFQNDPSFGAEIEPDAAGTPCKGYYRRRGWFASTPGILLVGDKLDEPKLDEVYLDILRSALQIAMQSEKTGMPTGLAGYSAWAADLLKDEYFPVGDETVLRQRHEVHNFMVGQVAELRWYGAVGLAAAIQKLHYKHAEQALKAAGCMAGEHELMWQVWDLAGGISNPDAWRKLAEPDVRRQMVRVILQSRDKYIEAMHSIEDTLKK
jgi:hypothetical protein